MKIHFLTSAHNSLSQRLLLELTGRGHAVTVALALSEEVMLKSVAEHAPLIIAPMLKIAVPEAIWSKHTCLIVHPGIKGDRGPSSLDWAIMTSEMTWGVSILQAAAEFDAGPIWATHNFPLHELSTAKSSLYRHEVTEAAVRGVLEAVAKFESRQFQPEPLDYSQADVRGCLRPPMRQADRAIHWGRDSTETITRKIRSADSAPGVRDNLFGRNYFLYGAQLARDAHFWRLLIEKNEQRLTHERRKPLASYREEELAKMRVNYFGADRAYHQARQAFVFKGKVPAKEKLRPIPVPGEGTAIAKSERRPAPMTDTSGLEIRRRHSPNNSVSPGLPR